jgi:rubrerythrin
MSEMNETTIQIAPRLDSPDRSEAHSLETILASALKSKTNLQTPGDISTQAFWAADQFNLHRLAIFKQSSDAEPAAIVQHCSASLIAESYYIEKCGMYFAPKMCLLAENTQEKMLYSLFAADEATHFSWMTKFASADAIADYLHNPFIQMLNETLQHEDKTTLTYIVQVILEGWGISHYHTLMKNCRNATLKQVLENILKDEARHHGSGLLLFNEKQLGPYQLERILEILVSFFRLVQVGQQMVVAQIERVKGHLSREQKAQIFTELQCELETAKRIATLKALIRSAAYADVIIEKLERANSFNPFTPLQCASVN